MSDTSTPPAAPAPAPTPPAEPPKPAPPSTPPPAPKVEPPKQEPPKPTTPPDFESKKVKMLRACLILDKHYTPGEVVEVVEPHATHLVNSGAATFA